MLKPNKDSAQVRFPPPFVVLLSIGMAWCVRFVNQKTFLPQNLAPWIGAIFLILGISLMFLCALFFKKHKTHIEPWRSTSVIMTEGPYRFSRNPIYLSFLIILFGSICLMNNLYALSSMVPLYLFLRFYVIKNEEKYLEGKFGESYLNFKNSTRRWL